MNLSVPSSLLLALNGVEGVHKIQLRGRNATISNSAQTVWGKAGAFVALTAGVAMEVVSSSANDTTAGTGARTVTVKGVDGNWAPFTEVVTLSGATPVALTTNTSVIGINKVFVTTAGSGLTNAGTIDVRVVSGAVVKAEITIGATLGLGHSADFIYTVPTGYVAVLGDVYFGGTGVTGDLTVYLNTTDSAGILRNMGAAKSSLYVTAFNGAMNKIHMGCGQVIPTKHTLELRAIVSAGAGDLVAMADLYLVNTSSAKWGTGSAGIY